MVIGLFKRKKEPLPLQPASLLKTAEKAGILGIVSDWLASPQNKEQAAKNWTYFEVFVHHAGENRIAEFVFNEWLSDIRITELAATDWEGVSKCLSYVKGKAAKVVLEWLKEDKNTEHASKDWHAFSNLLDACTTHRIFETTFKWLSKKGNAEQAAKSWSYFSSTVRFAGHYKLDKTVFEEWLSNAEFAGEAAKSWEGVSKVVDHAGHYNISKIVFGWLKDLGHTKHAARNWIRFSGIVLNAGINKNAAYIFS